MAKYPIIHIELSARDLKETSEFYKDVFDWKIEQLKSMDYATFEAEGGPPGGFNPVSSEYPAGTVIVYIYTDDIESDLKKIVDKGGSIVSHKTEIPGTGWFGMFKDPTGNLMGLYTPMKK